MKGRMLADRIATSSEGRPTLPSPRDAPSRRVTLCVLGKFDLSVGEQSVPLGAINQRLLTLVAVRSGQIPRSQAAGIMWPETRTSRAAANLRSAIWRLQQSCSGVVVASFYDLQLARGIAVDIHQASEVALELLDRSGEMTASELKKALRCNLYEDLAADIGRDEWLLAERERFRQLRVHALEALADQLLAAGCHGLAIEAVLGAIRADPFRERAHQLLVATHVAEGSQLEARRRYHAYCELLRTELGSTPSAEFMTLGHENGSDLHPPTGS